MNNFDMGCENGEDMIHSNGAVGKRFKFPKKFFDECNGVDHVSVPRKLRSAIKKRRRHSISPTLPGSKKLNHMSDGADETLRKAIDKSKLNLTHCGSSQCEKELEGPITKEEEEVAETLYALAGLIPDSGTMSEGKLKSLALPEPGTSAIASGQVVKEEQETRTTSSQVNAEASKQFPDAAVSAGEAVKSISIECDTSIRTEQLEISQQPVVAYGYQANQLNTRKEKRRNGSLLWPGLSVEGSPFSDILGSSTQSPIAKLPACFGSTGTDAQAQKAESRLPTVKNSQVPLDLKKSFKRCAAHVYISRLIKVLQTTAKEETVSSQPSQLSSHDGLKQGTHIIHNSLTAKVNDMHGIVPTVGIACSTTEKNPTEVRNAILLHKRLLQDEQQGSTTSGFNSIAKKNMDFLSLSAGSYVIKGTNVANIAGHKLNAPLNSPNHSTLRFLLPQNGYSSTSFHCLPATSAAAQQLQVLLPPYLGGSSSHPSLEATMTLPRQSLQHTELENLQNVSANFTDQYKFGVSASQVRDWQFAGLQTPIFRPSLAQFATSSSSMEPLSSKYSPTLLNDHELMSISTSRATSRNRGQYYNIPYALEGNAHGLYPNNVPSLQLLCNDHR